MTKFRSHTATQALPASQQQLLLEIMSARQPDTPVNPTLSLTQGEKNTFLYINNPDNTVRWVIPQQARKPHFLSLYSANSLKAWIFRNGVKLGYKLGQKERLFQGGFSLNENEYWDLPELLYQLAGHEYAIFTGTAGKTRKTVAAIAPNGSVSHFIKVAHTARAQALLDNEYKTLRVLNRHPFQYIETPKIEKLSASNMLMLSNIKPAAFAKGTDFSAIHMAALQELWQFEEKTKAASASWFEELFEKLTQLPDANFFPNDLDKESLQRLITNLRKLGEDLKEEKSLTLTVAHGDFTPWNMYATADKLHLFDWEYSRSDYPLYFDFFHYFYQSEILLQKSSKGLFKKMTRLASRHLDPQWPLLHKWYLLINLTNYLHDYSTWENVFPQAHWLLDAWLKITENL